jgi:hypothetical protein
MSRFKRTALALAGTTALLVLPITPAAAAGPLLFAPFALGHALGALTRLATLPLIAAAQLQPPAAYPQGPAYYPPPQSYYAPPQPYYAPAPGYGYARAYGRPPAPHYYYGPPRGDYAPYARYAGTYGPHFAYRSGGYGYRRR